MKLEAPSTDLFYSVIKENGKDEFDKLAKELANNLNAARKRYEDEQKAEAERQRIINERQGQETRAGLAIASHLNDLFGDIWPMEESSNIAKQLIADMNEKAAKMNQVKDAVDKVVDKVPVVEEKETPTSKKTVRKGVIDPKDADFSELYKLIADIFK